MSGMARRQAATDAWGATNRLRRSPSGQLLSSSRSRLWCVAVPPASRFLLVEEGRHNQEAGTEKLRHGPLRFQQLGGHAERHLQLCDAAHEGAHRLESSGVRHDVVKRLDVESTSGSVDFTKRVDVVVATISDEVRHSGNTGKHAAEVHAQDEVRKSASGAAVSSRKGVNPIEAPKGDGSSVERRPLLLIENAEEVVEMNFD